MRFNPKTIGLLSLAGGVSCAVLFGVFSQPQALTDRSDVVVSISTLPSKIAITLDDLPYLSPSKTSPFEGLRYVQSINLALEAHGIIATGFAVGQQITEDTIPALQAFVDAGHTLGNHSWSHPDYGTLTTRQFRNETLRTDRVLSQWTGGGGYYRFPFLREGETEDTKTAATQVLTELGYQNVPVSIDNDEWRFNAEYLEAIAEDDTVAANRISDRYLVHMQQRTAYFQTLAQGAFGRDVNHILLLHMNRINADHLGRLLDWYVAEGWAFITVEEAMTDTVYSAPDIYAGARGLSQIERVIGHKSD